MISAIASTLTPCRCSRSTWAWMSRAAAERSSRLARPVDAAGDELRVAGEQAQDVDVLEEADVVAVRLARRGAACCAASSGAAPSKMKSSALDRDDVEMADVADRRIERQPPQHHRLGEVHAGDDADARRRRGRTAR